MDDATNPFFAASTLPYQLPPVADIRNEHFLPAFERGIAEQLAEIGAITASAEAPTFQNTMIPLEQSGQTLRRVADVFFNQSSADSNEFTNALEEQLAPMLAAHEDAIRLDPALYARITALYRALDGVRDGVLAGVDSATVDSVAALDAEAAYLVRRYYTRFTLAGAALSDDEKSALREYNQVLSTLTTKFEKNLLTHTNDLAVVFTEASDLDGLSEGDISAAAAAARERGLDAGFVVTLVLPTGHPMLAGIADRGARKRIMDASRARGVGGENDNRALVLEITRLRAERARLLGFESHAAAVTADETAGSPAAVADLLARLAPAAARNARAEQSHLEGVAGHPIESWDWAYVTEQVRKATYDIDLAALRPYFEAERVLRDGVFYAATQLYGVAFAERPDLVAYHPDARVFEVSDEDGSPVGLYVLDLYTRDSKRGGAWMNPLVSQSRLLGTPTVVVNNLNVPKPAAGEPTLLSFDETTTLFHEFGHALHGLFASVTYPTFAGTSVHRDFVEFPSQVNEMWMLWPDVVANYAVHYVTGERMPQHLVDKLHASAAFNQGFATSEYLAAAVLDQAWHAIHAGDVIDDVAGFEADALTRAGLANPAVPPRYASTYFAHTFSGGYDAGYYSYIWSEVLDADTVEWFTVNGGLTRANGDRFRQLVLGVGGSMDPLEAYREFRGRDAAIEPLLKRRGLDG